MSAIKAMNENVSLHVKLTAAATDALKAGMSKDDVLAAVQKLAELIESSDD